MSAPDPRRDDDELLAAELALGLLDPADRAAAEARLASDAELAALHARWLEQAAALLDGADAAPPAAVWTAIETRLPANDDAQPALSTKREVRRWQGATLVASAIAASLLVALAVRPPAPPPPAPVAAPQPVQPLVAVLTGQESKATVSVRIDRAHGILAVAPAKLALGASVPELWVIGSDKTPRAIGVVAADARTTTAAPPQALAMLAAGATLAISVEPVGGSPTGKPTGPVILTGVIAAT